MKRGIMTKSEIAKRTDREQMEKGVLWLINRLCKLPKDYGVMVGLDPKSIIVAYTRGDISLNQASRVIRNWRIAKNKGQAGVG